MPAPEIADSVEEEYRGQCFPHIEAVMARLQRHYPPRGFPHTGPREAAREGHIKNGGVWALGTATAPDGRKMAEAFTGTYFVGTHTPQLTEAPQCIYWIPPGEDECRYVATGDRTGYSRGRSGADWDPTAEYPRGGGTEQPEPNEQATEGEAYARTGALVQPWTVWVWGNAYQDTEELHHWVASCAHDQERSQPEKFGEQWTCTRGGWTKVKPGNRGMMWKMTINLVTPIVRAEFSRVVGRSATVKEREVLPSLPQRPEWEGDGVAVGSPVDGYPGSTVGAEVKRTGRSGGESAGTPQCTTTGGRMV